MLDDAPDGAEIYNVGVMDERTIEDVAHAVAACYDRKIKVIPGKLPKGSPPRRLPDTAKITALGYPGPKTGFADAVKLASTWYANV
jgi:nucleoside-diphosphate-sugar epimerase